MSCAELAAHGGLPLAGTATQAERWLLVEWGAAWGRDAVTDTELPCGVTERLASFAGRVLLVRRPGSRQGATLINVVSTEMGGEARVLRLAGVEDVASADLDAGDPVTEPIVLVCTHGRRDACCARLGVPTYDALQEVVALGSLWQSSHQGGHRFAANVLVLPWGVQLGRVEPADARRVAAALAAGRIPLDHYRGRTLYPPAVQAAEIAVRRELRLDQVADMRFEHSDGEAVRFSTVRGDAVAVVEERRGPTLPASCGADPEQAGVWAARLESVV
jgi:hypothetical protein